MNNGAGRDCRSSSATDETCAGTLAALPQDLAQAFGFLTILPIPAAVRAAPSEEGAGRRRPLARCLHLFPVVGGVVGAVAAAVWALAHGVGLPPAVAAGLAVATAVLITGGLHEDGLGDVADGFGGGRTRDDKLRIMRDSRIGSFGVLALLLVVVLKISALAALPMAAGAAALVAAGALSRAVLPAILRGLPSARSAGLGADAGRPHRWQVAIAVALALVLTVLVFAPAAATAAAAGAAVGAGAIAVIARRQIGGQTGDVCGAAQQLSDVAVLIALVATA